MKFKDNDVIDVIIPNTNINLTIEVPGAVDLPVVESMEIHYNC